MHITTCGQADCLMPPTANIQRQHNEIPDTQCVFMSIVVCSAVVFLTFYIVFGM